MPLLSGKQKTWTVQKTETWQDCSTTI